jgi:3alpha(or 20beta)-hydroxysteroid dehydrogenase
MDRVKGKVVLITGGARGMGASHTRHLVEEGAKVILTDILDAEGEQLANDLGANALFLHHDVTDEEQWQQVVARAVDHFGPVSVLVNNAGVSAVCEIEHLNLDDYRRVVDINQTSVFLGMKSIIPTMKRAGGGSIINISSIAGLNGAIYSLAYCASKFAVRGMTKVAALELARYNISVNSIHPGIIETPMTEMTDENQVVLQKMIDGTPAKRLGKPDEVSALILLLASDECQFATGSEFTVDGGASCQ